MIKRWFPHPGFSVLLALVWLMLMDSFSLGQILLAVLVGWFMPWSTESLWPRRTPLKKPLMMGRYVLVLLYDIIVANLVVAWWIIGPSRRLKPAFVEYPTELTDRLAISVLANTISLTPGSVTADISLSRSVILIHALNVTDDEALVRTIRERYEQPLKEIFE